MTRDELKMLIKECLVEILSEGLGGEMMTEARRPASKKQAARPVSLKQIVAPQRRTGLDHIAFGNQRPTMPNPPQRMPQVREAVREVSAANPMMASIFADTANTTLVSQGTSNDHSPGAQMGGPSLVAVHGDMAAKIMEQVSDPTEVFGAASAKWAEAAFAPRRGAPQLHAWAASVAAQDDYNIK